MQKLYHILLIEDQEADAELIKIHLKKAELNAEITTISTRKDLFKSLKNASPDLVISDYNLQDLNGDEILKIVRDEYAELPFILVTGYLGEKKAVEIMTAGANDYVMKDELDRLGLAAKREIENYKKNKEFRERLKGAYSLSKIGHWEYSFETNDLYWSNEVKDIHGVNENYEPTVEKALSFSKKGEHREYMSRVFEQALKDGQPYEVEVLLLTGNREERWVRTNGKPEFRNGKCVRVYGSIQDITERKNAELALEESEKTLKEIFKFGTNVFYRHGTNNVLTYVSPQISEFLGYTPEEAKINWQKFLTDHPINKVAIKKTETAIQTGIVQKPYKIQMNRKDGSEIWARVNEAPVLENGKTKAIVGSLTDITELEEKREQLEKAQKIGKIGDWEYDIKTGDISWSDTLFDIYERNPALGPPDFEQITNYHPENRDFFLKSIERAIELAIPYSFDIKTRTENGNVKYLHLEGIPKESDNGDVTELYGIVQDVTDRKKIEKELQEKQKRLEDAQRIGIIGDWDYDLETGDVSWSDMLFEIYERDPALGPPSLEEQMKHYPEDHDLFLKSVKEAVESAAPYSFDIRMLTEKKNEKFVHLEGIPVTNGQGKVEKVLGIAHDITERKEKELQVFAKQKQLQSITDNVAALLFQYTLKPDGTDQFRNISESINEIFEVTSEEAIKSSNVIWDQVYEEDVPKLRGAVQESATNLSTFDCRYRVQTPSGKHKWLLGRGNPTRLKDGSVQWNTIVLDVTEQVQQEKKNEALVQEVHHRVKNNLAIITGFLELQLMELNEDRSERLPLERAMTRIYSIAEVHKLLYDGSSLIGVSVGEYVTNLVKHVTGTMKFTDKPTVDIQIDELQMNVNELTPLGMLLNELLTNSLKYAFNDNKHGKITINISEEDQAYKVVYQDNGPGIKPEKLDQAKTSGLNIVKILLKQLEAEYQLSNEDGFLLTFSFEERTRGAHGNIGV